MVCYGAELIRQGAWLCSAEKTLFCSKISPVIFRHSMHYNYDGANNMFHCLIGELSDSPNTATKMV